MEVFYTPPYTAQVSPRQLNSGCLDSKFIVVPSEIWVAAVAGTGDTDAALVIEFFLTAAMLVAACVAVFVVFTASLTYVWTSLLVAELICLVLSYAWVKAGY